MIFGLIITVLLSFWSVLLLILYLYKLHIFRIHHHFLLKVLTENRYTILQVIQRSKVFIKVYLLLFFHTYLRHPYSQNTLHHIWSLVIISLSHTHCPLLTQLIVLLCYIFPIVHEVKFQVNVLTI